MLLEFMTPYNESSWKKTSLYLCVYVLIKPVGLKLRNMKCCAFEVEQVEEELR